jgi:sigma-E factor negative regulatory protein RseB
MIQSSRPRPFEPAWRGLRQGLWGSAFVFFLGLFMGLTLQAHAAGQSAGASEESDQPHARAKAMVQRATDSATRLNFSGTYVHQHAKGIYSAKVRRGNSAEGRVTVIDALDGPARRTIRLNSQVRAYLPDQKQVRVYPGAAVRLDFPHPPVYDFSRMTEHYQLRVSTGKRIAGRMTDRLEFVPHNQSRWSVHCWFDQATGLMLKTQTLDPSGAVLEEHAFSELTLETSSQVIGLEAPFEDIGVWQRVTAPIHREPMPQSLKAYAGALGFHPLAVAKVKEPSSSIPHTQWLFTDGIALVSVFFIQDTKLHGQAGSTETTDLKGATAMIVGSKSGYHLTALGEVPIDTAKSLIATLPLPQQ